MPGSTRREPIDIVIGTAARLLANLLAATAARQVPAQIVLGFRDEAVVQLLSLDPQREGALALVGLGKCPGSFEQTLSGSTAVELRHSAAFQK